jgi:hypothetical protein
VEVVGTLAPELLFDVGVEPLANLLKRVLCRELSLPDRTRVAAHAAESFRWDTAADALENAWHEFALDPEIPKRK